MTATQTAPDPLRILVAGATGRLRPVSERLLARGHRVRVMTRDAASPIARELAARGAEVVRADFDDPRSLQTAARGVDAVFAAGSPHQAGPDGEARHGINMAEAARAAAVPHLVFASGAGAERPTGVPVFDSKHAVEQRIRALGAPHTILAPVYFMDNAFNPWNLPALARGRFPLPLPADRPLQQVAVEDLASFAALVLERPGEFIGERVEIASDRSTGPQAAEIVSRVSGRRFEFQHVPLEALTPGLRALFGWLERVGHGVDIQGLRRSYPEVGWHSFADWARTQEWPVAA